VSLRKDLALILLFAFRIAAQSGAGKTATIEGTVTDSVTGAPIPRVHVTLNGSIDGLPGRYGATAAADGKFSITGIAPGSYSLAGERVGFVSMPRQHTNASLTMKADDHKTDVDLKLMPAGAITGRVTDAQGEPVEGANVEVQGARGGQSRATDENGQFRIGGLAPGRYRVLASANDIWKGPPEIRTDGTVEVHNAATYYPSVITANEAGKVAVQAGVETTGVDIQFVRVPFVRVSGKIFGAPKTADRVVVMVLKNEGGEGREVKPDGSFEIWHLDPGKYKLVGQWNDRDGRQVQTVTANIQVAESDIDNIELRVVPDSEISGRLEFQDDRAKQMPASDDGSRNVVLNGDGLWSEPPAPASIGTDDTFHLEKVPAGKYQVRLSWDTAYVKSMQLGSTTFDGSVLDLRNGAGKADLTLLVAAATGSISGAVRDDKGNAAADTQVSLVESDSEAESPIRFSTTMSDGTYTFANLPPGSYKIAAGEPGELETNAETVDLGDGDKVTKDLKAPAADHE